MIYGVGIDIIEVMRVAEKISKGNGFKEKVFSAREIAICEEGTRPGEHFAARFAAKEAFLKATGKGLLITHDLSQIEILNDESGKPFINLTHEVKEAAAQSGWSRIHVSLSHINSAACAVVIIES